MPHKDPEERRAYLDRTREHRNQMWREWRARNREARNAKQREAATAPDRRAWQQAYNHAYYEANKLKLQDQMRDYRYGLPVGEFDRLVEAQGGRCAICGEVPSKTINRTINNRSILHVDHAHGRRGPVRGLLCSPCNVALGLFQDNPERLRAAADYLERSCVS